MSRFFTLIFSILLFLTAPAWAVTYYTPQEVLALFYPKAVIQMETKTLTSEQLTRAKTALGRGGISKTWSIHVAKIGNQVQGYVLIDNVPGRERPITYAVNIAPDGKVRAIEVLVYRENYGAQIKNQAFRKQFVGRKMSDTLTLGQDIQNISGATISARSITVGVKRALAVWQQFYGSPQ